MISLLRECLLVRHSFVSELTDASGLCSFNLGDAGSGICEAALGGEDLGLGSNVWLFGDT